MSLQHSPQQTKLDVLFLRQGDARREKASAEANIALSHLRALGVEIGVIGSLAKGTFKRHSDVDFLVKDLGPLSDTEIFCALSDAMKSVPFDMVLLNHASPDFLPEMLAEYTVEAT
jgi:predicted nucleotidyltransferase